jgi:hypothetical protein
LEFGGTAEVTTTAAVTSSITVAYRCLDDKNLVDAILRLPEKEFWDLVDIRLNRPKGFLRLQGQLRPRQEYLEITETNDEPLIVGCWTEERLIDELFLELAITKSLVSHNGKWGITVHKYYNRALALLKWIPIARPAPKFVIDKSDLSSRVLLDSPQIILKQAVGRIFENIDEQHYHLSIARALEVVLN